VKGYPGALVRSAIAAVLAVLGLLAAAPAASAQCAPDPGWGTPRPALEPEVVQLVNAHRAGLGIPLLATSPTLSAAARWKSMHMAFGSYVTHDDPAPPVARTWDQRVRDCGYPNAYMGENIAAGASTARQVMDGWLASPGHRANIENPGFVAIGVGAAADGGGVVFWTQDFGTVVDAGSLPPGAPPPPPPPPPAPPVALPPAAQTPQGIRCVARGRRIRCRVAIAGPVTRVTSARLVRRGRVRARSTRGVRVRAGIAVVRLRAARRPARGRYVLVLRTRDGGGAREVSRELARLRRAG